MMNTFYVVWNIARGLPTYRHNTLDAAVKEAERLARVHPGQQFHVLGSMGVACQPEPPSIYMSTPLGLTLEVPF